MEIINRKEAKEKGLKYYFTGKICIQNHNDARLVSNGKCVSCRKTCSEKYYITNKEKILEKAKNYKELNKKLIKEATKKYRNVNNRKIITYQQKYRKENKESINKKARDYQKINSFIYNFHNSKRRARKLQATPKWANLLKIKEIYRDRPKGMQVDHIIPLKGKLVCGLHVEYNLQYLTPEQNKKKANKYKI